MASGWKSAVTTIDLSIGFWFIQRLYPNSQLKKDAKWTRQTSTSAPTEEYSSYWHNSLRTVMVQVLQIYNTPDLSSHPSCSSGLYLILSTCQTLQEKRWDLRLLYPDSGQPCQSSYPLLVRSLSSYSSVCILDSSWLAFMVPPARFRMASPTLAIHNGARSHAVSLCPAFENFSWYTKPHLSSLKAITAFRASESGVETKHSVPSGPLVGMERHQWHMSHHGELFQDDNRWKAPYCGAQLLPQIPQQTPSLSGTELEFAPYYRGQIDLRIIQGIRELSTTCMQLAKLGGGSIHSTRNLLPSRRKVCLNRALRAHVFKTVRLLSSA